MYLHRLTRPWDLAICKQDGKSVRANLSHTADGGTRDIGIQRMCTGADSDSQELNQVHLHRLRRPWDLAICKQDGKSVTAAAFDHL